MQILWIGWAKLNPRLSYFLPYHWHTSVHTLQHFDHLYLLFLNNDNCELLGSPLSKHFLTWFFWWELVNEEKLLVIGWDTRGKIGYALKRRPRQMRLDLLSQMTYSHLSNKRVAYTYRFWKIPPSTKKKSPLHVYWFRKYIPTSTFIPASSFSDLAFVISVICLII